MTPETRDLVQSISDEAKILLSGFGPTGKTEIAAAISRIAIAGGAAYLAQTGQPIDESLIRPAEQLTPEDLPHAEEPNNSNAKEETTVPGGTVEEEHQQVPSSVAKSEKEGPRKKRQ